MRKISGMGNLNYIAAGVILLALTVGCDFLIGPGELPEGNVTLRFDRGGNGARAVSQGFINTFRYEVEFRGPGGALINRSAPVGTGSVQASLALGTWDISAAAYIPDGHLAGTGSVTVTIAPGGGAITVPMTLGMTYALGETGPGGGLVFYDKGAYSGGWRYLEVCPEDLDPDTDSDDVGDGVNWCDSNQMSAFGVTPPDPPLTGTSVGDGLDNTLLIISLAGDNNGNPYAARLCAEYRGGGLDDWFLPSLDELGALNSVWFSNDAPLFSGLGLITTGSGHSGSYWSSSEDGDGGYAKYCGFISAGYTGSYWGSNPAHVRAVRRF